MMKTNKQLWIYGASGHGKVILDCLMASEIKVSGFIDDDQSKTSIVGYPVKSHSSIDPIKDQVIIGIGNNKTRKRLSEINNFRYLKVIHPSALLSNFAEIGEGSVVFHHSVIQTGTKIGTHCIINTSASIDHDCIVEDFAHISPKVTLCGNVKVGEGTHVGAGAIVIPGIKIGKWATIGAGAVIIKDVPDYAVVVGNPGRIIRINEPF
jgi:acetyltransferase EpsM